MSAQLQLDQNSNVLHLSAEVRDAWTKLSREVPVYHLSRRVFVELESYADIPINPKLIGKKPAALAIAVDDAAGADGDQAQRSATDIILLNGNEREWNFFERSRIDDPLSIARSQVIAVVWFLRKALYTSLPSDDFGYYAGSEPLPWGASQDHTERIIRTFLSFLWLVGHDQVTISAPVPIDGQEHFVVNVPDELLVSTAIGDLLAGRHVSKPTFRLGKALRTLLNALWTKASQRHTSPTEDETAS